MKFIKNTLLTASKSSINISALGIHNNPDIKINNLEKQLQSQYEKIKSQTKNIKHLPKYQAFLQSLQSLMDNKNNVINKKIETLMSSLHINSKKKQKQIPLLQAFLDLSLAQRYKFMIDILKHAEQHQKNCQKQRQRQKLQSPYNSPSKKKQFDQKIQQKGIKIVSQASISLNELKTMSLSYWTKVNFELNCKKRQIRVTGKQSFILYLQNYLIRVSKNQKHCLVLLCAHPQQVPSWLRKVYIHLKKQIFISVFQSIWNQIIFIQLQKLDTSFQDVANKDYQASPTKSIGQSSSHQDQFQIDKDDYLVFLTPLIIKNYLSDKNKFIMKIKHSNKFSLFKQIQFNGVQSQNIRQKLQKISFFKALNQKNKQIYQVKGYFNIPSSIVKFKFIDSLKQRNKFINSWQILQNQPTKSIQAISQSFNFTQLFQNQMNLADDSLIFKFKQLSLKQQNSNFGKDQQKEILSLQSIKQISKTSVMNFLLVECEKKKNEKSELIITCQFNKNLIKSKIKKLKLQSISKQNILQMSRTIIENFLKQMILMIFTQQKMYEEKTIRDEQQFFTICQAFSNQIDELDIFSSKSIKTEEQIDDQYNLSQDKISISDQTSQISKDQCQNQSKVRKSNSLNSHQINEEQVYKLNLHLKKSNSLNLNLLPTEKQHQNQIDNNVNLNTYLKRKIFSFPKQKTKFPLLVKQNLLESQWKRLDEGGLTCTNETKIKQQKQIIKKILVKLGQSILKQKNIMHVSLPVTIFKTQSQLTTVARGLTYAPLLLESQYHLDNKFKVDILQRIKRSVIFLISNSYSQINFQKPFNPILGQTLQCWIDGCPVYMEQISHHPPISSYYLFGRGYKIYGALEPSLSMGINHAKVTSHCVDNILFDDGTLLNAGPNRMMVNGTTFGLRIFNLDQKNYVFDSTNSILALFSYGPIKKGLFSNSNEPTDFIKGKIMKMTQHFNTFQFLNWKHRSDYPLKKEWIQKQISTFEGLWSKKIYFDGIQYFDFDKQLPYELVEQQYPLLSDGRYREDLKQLIKGDLNKSQQYKQKLEEDQRYDKKLRTKKK